MKKLTWLMVLTFTGAAQALAADPPNPRYEIKGGEVYDNITKLTWQRCSVGLTWNGKECRGAIKTLTFAEAQNQANGEWRVPSKDELATLIDPHRRDFPTIDLDAFPDLDQQFPTYWSSTPTSDAGRAWDVRFEDGNVTDDVSVRKYAVRLVHKGK